MAALATGSAQSASEAQGNLNIDFPVFGQGEDLFRSVAAKRRDAVIAQYPCQENHLFTHGRAHSGRLLALGRGPGLLLR